ncbi:MAG: hypothetical protein ABIG94_08670 [Pseudomonadota bacterium]
MGEPQIITFEYKEIVKVLLKHQGIHEGLWAIVVQFGLQAANIKVGPSEGDVVPAAILPLVKMGIQKSDKPTPLTVDAAEVNPPPKP